jgi:signal transduction histidine kinase
VNDRTMSAQQWRDMTAFVVAGIAKESVQADTFFRQHAASSRLAVYIRFAAAAAIGLIALLASVIVSVRVGRALIHDLSELRKEANEAAGVRLPSVMRRLAAGDAVEVESAAPRLDYERHEIGQVGQALNTLQRAAVEATVKQADLRRGVAEVFVNLARRNQVLLHRQLGLLDTMERRTEDTEELADLFRLDHLTTRMRRHAEGLVILSGAVPSRQWRKPVQLMDVVRAAVAEVEDYERIEVRRLPRIGVGGPAVADLTHLLAELLENATVFSPPHTAVQVTGDRVAGGFTLEIHDRGLGMPPETLLDANLRLAETPEFELSDTDRLGLFVVSRLAQRQNVRVSLQPSPYGGTTAVVLLPAALLTDAPDTQTGFRLDRKDRAGSESPRSRTDSGGIRLAALGVRDDAEAFGAADAEEQHQQASEPLPALESDPPELPRRRPPTLVADRGRRLDEQQGRAHPLPQGEQRQDEARPPRGPVSPAEPPSAPFTVSQTPPAVPDAPSAVSDTPSAERRKQRAPEPDSALGGLPRRVRQASLAPQLKDNAPERAAGRAPEKDKDQDAERDADAVRDRMASLQRGWQRGRRQNEAEDDAGHPGGTQGTTSEGDGR